MKHQHTNFGADPFQDPDKGFLNLDVCQFFG